MTFPKGKFSEELAIRKGMIACQPVSRLLNMWLEEQYDGDGQIKPKRAEVSALTGLVESTGLYIELFWRVSRGEKEWIKFDQADKIICHTYGPLAWVTEPDLNDLYQSFDFTYLDLRNPPTPDADGLLTLHSLGLRPGLLARMYGVSYAVLHRYLKDRLVAA